MATKTVKVNFENDVNQFVIHEAAKRFEETYANLLVCFDTNAVFNALANYFKLEGPVRDLTVPNIVAATERAFIILLERGALDDLVKLSPLPQAAQDELDEMKSRAGEV